MTVYSGSQNLLDGIRQLTETLGMTIHSQAPSARFGTSGSEPVDILKAALPNCTKDERKVIEAVLDIEQRLDVIGKRLDGAYAIADAVLDRSR